MPTGKPVGFELAGTHGLGASPECLGRFHWAANLLEWGFAGCGLCVLADSESKAIRCYFKQYYPGKFHLTICNLVNLIIKALLGLGG